jgi:hypothetical protein
MIPSLPKQFRSWLVRTCAAWLGATFILGVAALLWGLLGLLGDESGAAAARGIVVLVGILWLALLSGVVLLLTWERIAHHTASAEGPPAIPAGAANVRSEAEAVPASKT